MFSKIELIKCPTQSKGGLPFKMGANIKFANKHINFEKGPMQMLSTMHYIRSFL